MTQYSKYNFIYILFSAIFFILSGCSSHNAIIEQEREIVIKNIPELKKINHKKNIAIFFEDEKDLNYCIKYISRLKNKNMIFYPINLNIDKEISDFFTIKEEPDIILILSENIKKISLIYNNIGNGIPIFTTSSYKKPNVYNINIPTKSKILHLLKAIEEESYIIPILSYYKTSEYNFQELRDVIDDIEHIKLFDIMNYEKNKSQINKKESIISKIHSYILLHSLSEKRIYTILVADDIESSLEYLKLAKKIGLEVQFLSPELTETKLNDIITLKGNNAMLRESLIHDIIYLVTIYDKDNLDLLYSKSFQGLTNIFTFKNNQIEYILSINGRT